jgi:hypothetical protein
MSVGNNFHFERQQQAASRGTSQPASGAESPVEKTETQTENETAAVTEENPSNGDAAQLQSQQVPAVKAQGPAHSASRTRSVPNTRAHSPNSSPAVAPRAPRTGGRPQHSGNGQAARSTSIPAAAKEVKQKLPSADDFPALAGSVGSLNGQSLAHVGARLLHRFFPRRPHPSPLQWRLKTKRPLLDPAAPLRLVK